METLSTTAQDDSSGANPSSVKSEDSSPRNEAGRGSPPPNCAICLGTCRNKSFTDTCLHEFCFKCLLTWSKVKAVCPLCKQNFRSIIHNVRSNHQYDEYTVEQRHTEEITERLDIDTLTTRRFRYSYQKKYIIYINPAVFALNKSEIDQLVSKELKIPNPELDSLHLVQVFVTNTGTFYIVDVDVWRTTLTLPRRESIAIQQLLMHYPLMADVFPSPRSPAAPPAPSSTAPPLRRRSPASFRRSVYRYNLWARPLADFTGRFRDCSPEFYRYNDSQIHRLVPWLNRELHYLLNENVGHIAYVISRIIELLPEYHITSSEFRETMRSYFGDRTRHFLHELYNFASTPYDMTGYDRNVQYTTDPRMSTMVNEVISSSESEASADSDIVMISSSEPAEPPPGPSRVPAPVYPNNYIPEPINNIIPIETISQSDTDDDSSEVMVVGYIKPPQDRTPEVVDLLGSDSDVMVQETPTEAPPVAPEAAEGRPAPLVKLTMTSTLSRSNSTDSTDSEGSAYTPSPPPRRRHASQDSDMSSEKFCTSDFSADSIARKAAHPPTRTPSSSSFSSSSSSSFYTSWNESESSYDNVKRKKARRKLTATERNKRKTKKHPSRKQHKGRKTSNTQEKKQSKRKSHSGKGVKSTKKNSEAPPELPPALDQPSTSGTASNRKRKLDSTKSQRTLSRESKRLKSVVSVIKSPTETSSSSKTNVQPISKLSGTTRDYNSDSEDDLPLNLTITKT